MQFTSDMGKIDPYVSSDGEDNGEQNTQNPLQFLVRTRADPGFRYYKYEHDDLALSPVYDNSAPFDEGGCEGYNCGSQITEENIIEMKSLLWPYVIDEVQIRKPLPDERAYPPPAGFSTVYYHHVVEAGLRLPLDSFIGRVVNFYNVNLCQITPNGIKCMLIFKVACIYNNVRPTVELFQCCYRIRTSTPGCFYFAIRSHGDGNSVSRVYSKSFNWKKNFAFVAMFIPSTQRHWSSGFENGKNDFVAPVTDTTLAAEYSCLQGFLKKNTIDASLVCDKHLLDLLSIFDQTVLCLKETPVRYYGDALGLFLTCRNEISKYVFGFVPQKSPPNIGCRSSGRRKVQGKACFLSVCDSKHPKEYSSESIVSGKKRKLLGIGCSSDVGAVKGKGKEKVVGVDEVNDNDVFTSDDSLEWLRDCVPTEFKKIYHALSVDEVKRMLSFSVAQCVALADVAISHLGQPVLFASEGSEPYAAVLRRQKESYRCISELNVKIRDLAKQLHQERIEKHKWRLNAKSWERESDSLVEKIERLKARFKK